MDYARSLNLNDSVCDQLDQLGHQSFDSWYGFKEFNSNGKVLSTRPRRTLSVDAMVGPKA